MARISSKRQFLKALGVATIASLPVMKAAADSRKTDEGPDFRLPMAALLISAKKHDFDGATQLAGICSASMGVDYVIHKLTGSGEWSPDHTTTNFCGASYLQSHYGSSYGIPAFSVAASLNAARPDEILPRLRNVFIFAAFNYALSREMTKYRGSDHNLSMMLNERGDLSMRAPEGIPESSVALGGHYDSDGYEIAPNQNFSKPKMNLELGRDNNGKVQGSLSFHIRIR